MAFVPGLLILATFWLGRLESRLAERTHAESVDVGMVARAGMREALGGPAPRSGDAEYRGDPALTSAVILGADRPGPLWGRYGHSRANRPFGPPRHVDGV
nr:hypothetical protein [Mycobacterium sp.]